MGVSQVFDTYSGRGQGYEISSPNTRLGRSQTSSLWSRGWNLNFLSLQATWQAGANSIRRRRKACFAWESTRSSAHTRSSSYTPSGRRCTERLVGALSQGVRYAGLRRVENQGEAEQSTDAAFRARGILPAVFTTSGEGTRGFIRTLYDKKSDVYMMSIRFYMVLIFCLLFNTYCFKCDLKYDAVFCFTYVRTYMICYTYDHSF